jgi:heme-degrading monooxygenase HmoA
MAVKVLIKRKVTHEKLKDAIRLFRELRNLALHQPGYISGETLRRLGKPEEFLVISVWQSSNDWKKWAATEERNEVQNKLDALLGGKPSTKFFFTNFRNNLGGQNVVLGRTILTS